MLSSATVAVFLHISVVLGAFSQTRPQATRTQPSIAGQDDYVKQPQMHKPLEPEELQEVEDIADLKLLGSMMHKFLVQVTDIETRLEMKKPHDLMDHVQLYLLGLPNKLGLLGFLALHHVLTDEEVDVAKVNAK